MTENDEILEEETQEYGDKIYFMAFYTVLLILSISASVFLFQGKNIEYTILLSTAALLIGIHRIREALDKISTEIKKAKGK